MNILLGIIGMLIGASMVIYSEKLLNFFGRLQLFERYLVTFGGSRLGYKIFGLVVFFISLVIFLDLFEEFVLWVFSPLMRHKQI